MGEDRKGNIIPGDKISEITTIDTFKKIMIDLLKGYPKYTYYGIFEAYFKEDTNAILGILKNDELIELASKRESKRLNKNINTEQKEMLKKEGKKEPIWYRLAPKGMDFAISMINLEHSENMLNFTKTIKTLTWIMVGVAFLTLGITMLNFPFIQKLIGITF